MTIDHVGSSGDGRFRLGGKWQSAAGALAGETVSLCADGRGRWRIKAVLEPSASRVDPSCRHFGTCGGCVLQHLAPLPYANFLRQLIIRALSSRGLVADVAETWLTPPASRRRASFIIWRGRCGPEAGYHARGEHTPVAISECTVLRPRIVACLPLIRQAVADLVTGRDTLRVQVTETDAGLDVHVSGVARHMPALLRSEAAAALLKAGFVRAAIEPDPPLTENEPFLHAGAAKLLPAPGGFLQATAEAETEMARLIAAHLSGARRVVDLFAGCGTFALRLAAAASVHAAEADGEALARLALAARRTGGLKPVTTDVRDLFRNPLSAGELAAFDAAILNPPRAGASAQARALAAAPLGRLAYVSCDPGTLARDLRTLVDGGWRIVRIHPLGQFLWSAHVEAVALLARETHL